MTEDTSKISADNLRAEFMDATTNWQRWKVLNKALDWAVVASENAVYYRQKAAELQARAEKAERVGTLAPAEASASKRPRVRG